MINEIFLAELIKDFEELIPDFAEDITFLRLDSEKCVLQHNTTKIKLVMDYSNETFSTITEILMDEFDQGNISKRNNSIVVYRDCGFYDKKKKYSEFLLTYESLYHDLRGFHGFKINYTLGDIEVEISEPSSLYRIIFQDFSNDSKTFVGNWSDFLTIKLKGCLITEQEAIVQQVLFLIAKYQKPEEELIGEYPAVIPYIYHGEHTKWNDPDDPDDGEDFRELQFRPVKYSEPIAFYNRAKKFDDPIFYYRIIEYFFIINKKSEIKKAIENYNDTNDLDKVIVEMSSLYRQEETELLKNLIKNIKDIEEVIEYAEVEGLVDSMDISSFSNKLYAYRNSIVHSKYDSKFKINVPFIEVLHPESKDRYWIEVLRRLSEKVIVQFC